MTQRRHKPVWKTVRSPKELAYELYIDGYRQVSRKFGRIARVNIRVEDMVQKFINENFGNKYTGVPSCSLEQQKDHYRRCYSKDKRQVTPEVMNEIRRLSEL